MKFNAASAFRALLLTSVSAALLSACATTPQQPSPGPVVQGPAQPAPTPTPTPKDPKDVNTPKPDTKPDPKPEPETPAFVRRDGLTPPHMQGRDIKRVALLLPFTSSNVAVRNEAASLLKAAEMAVFDRPQADVLLLALDTGGSDGGARAATDNAVKSGADVVIGPLLSRAVKSAGRAARRSRTPVIGFSTDQTAAGNGVYLLSFPPEAEVERITQYAAAEGARNFAILGPDNAYGRRVNGAYEKTVKSIGGQITASKSYAGSDINVMQGPASELARDFDKALEAKNAPLFDAIILPEGGAALRSVAPLLTYYSSEMATVQKLGTGRWDDPEAALEPALRGGIFAGPDQAPRNEFRAAYKLTYNEAASSLATLAYDAVNIAASVAEGDPATKNTRILDPRGFYGVDGFVRFRPDGTPDRGLAIYEVKAGRFEIIEPAPKSAVILGN